MKKFNNRSGFTLIEIIVVLIIVGILAAIALPNLFSNVSKSRAEEALATISTMRPTVESCIIKNAGVTDTLCTGAALGITAALDATSNFSYSLVPPSAAGDTGYTLIAGGTNALVPADTITVNRVPAVWPADGNLSCVGAGKLLGAC